MPRHRQSNGRTFASVIDAYMNSPKYQQLGLSTRRTYRRYLFLAAEPEGLGSVLLDEMRPALVQAFLDGLVYLDEKGILKGLAAQNKALTVMKAVERFAVVRDLLPREITTGCEAPGSDGGHVPWTDMQVDLAEVTVAGHLSRALTLGANTGQRGSDLVKMRWTDIEEIEGRPGINVTQQKTGRKLWVPFTQALIKAMATWERRPGFILTKPDGMPYGRRQQLTDAWDKERERHAELRHLTLHGLRGTA